MSAPASVTRQPRSPHIGKTITATPADSASIAFCEYSQRPWIPGTSTSADRTSVPERLARLERVLDALQRPALAAEPEKRLALEIEQVLLRHRRPVWQRAARQDVRE